MKIAIRLAALAPAIVFAATAAFAQGKLNVVATTEDLASIGREVGGDRISIEAIARGYQDPHFVSSAKSWRSAGCRRSSSKVATRKSRWAPTGTSTRR